MPIPGTSDLGYLNSASPINWEHPLNSGLVIDLTVSPNPSWRGSLTLHDLVRGGKNRHDGTLTSMAFPPTTTSGWAGPQGRFGGYGSIRFDGTNDCIVSSGPITSKTICAWVKFTATTIRAGFVQVNSTNQHVLASGNSGGRFATTPSTSASAGVETVAQFNDGKWHFAVALRDTNEIYVDGVSTATQVDTNNYSMDVAVTIGRRNATNFIASSMDGVMIYNRALIATEIAALFKESRQGNPNRWNWVRRIIVLDAVATGIAFDAASNSGSIAVNIGSTITWNHTCTGSNRFLVVDVGVLSAGQSVTGITYNGVALSLIQAKATVTALGDVETWGLVAPATGSNSIVVTLSGSGLLSAGEAVSYTGVHQTSPTEGAAGNQATNVGATDATVSITSVADQDWIHAAAIANDAAITANQTSRNNLTDSVSNSVADEDFGPQSPGAKTMGYTGVGAGVTWAIVGFAIRPVGSSSLSTVPWFDLNIYPVQIPSRIDMLCY